MTRSATGTLTLQAKTTLRNQLADGAIAQFTVGGPIVSASLESGVEANQINRCWQRKAISILSGGFVSFNLQTLAANDIGAGLGNDGLGMPLFIEEAVLLLIRHAGGAGVLEINPITPPAADLKWVRAHTASVATGGGLRAGGVRLWFEPGDEGLDLDTNSSVIRLAASGGDVSAEIYLWGRTDDEASSSSSSSTSSG